MCTQLLYSSNSRTLFHCSVFSPGHFALPGHSGGKTVLVYGKGDLEGDHLSSSEDINYASPKLEQLCSVHCTEDEVDSR